MNGLKTEGHILEKGTSLSLDIARRMADRLAYGQVVVVSKQPAALLASTRKQWLRVLRQLENQRASTRDAVKIAALSKKIARMQQTDFVAMSLFESIGTDVIFATAEQLLEFAPMCRTMFVATPTEKEMLYRVTSFMPKDGTVVVYELAINK